MTTYPARSGSIPTLQWKALADGIYDLRYLITFDSTLKRVEDCRSPEGLVFISEACRRFEQFLKRISLKEVNINSETNASSLSQIRSEEYSGFREQLARDIIILDRIEKNQDVTRIGYDNP